MGNKSDDLITQSEICAEASQISLIAEPNLKFGSRYLSLTLRNGGNYEKEKIYCSFTGYDAGGRMSGRMRFQADDSRGACSRLGGGGKDGYRAGCTARGY